MRIPSYRGTQGVAINMTPMIDVTFLLIIFFLVSSHLAKQENFLKLELPTATAASPDISERSTLTVQVLATGDYVVGGQTMPLEQVGRTMSSRREAIGEPIRVRIRTDRNTEYANIAALLKMIFAVYDEPAR
jgi:biopolymer transport protein ExbD